MIPAVMSVLPRMSIWVRACVSGTILSERGGSRTTLFILWKRGPATEEGETAVGAHQCVEQCN